MIEFNYVEKWTREKYLEFLVYLSTFTDNEFRDFNRKIVNDEHAKYIGIRTPIIDRITKELIKEDWKSFLVTNTHNYYEETLIHGKLLAKVKVSYAELVEMLMEYLPFVTNWPLCDTAMIRFKQIKNNEDDFLKKLDNLLSSNNPWYIRVALKLLHSNFVNDSYIEYTLKISESISNQHYYVKMMNAWLISECFIKCRTQTLAFFSKNKIDSWTINKAIQKIRESYRVASSDKELIKKYRR